MMVRISLADLRSLCDRFVPAASRHPASQMSGAAAWWPAHELGHLLVAHPAAIGAPLFGLDEPPDLDAARVHELRCAELAAMTVSRRLLLSAARPDLVRAEIRETDATTLAYDDRGRVAQILRERNCVRLPRCSKALEKRLSRAAAAGIAACGGAS